MGGGVLPAHAKVVRVVYWDGVQAVDNRLPTLLQTGILSMAKLGRDTDGVTRAARKLGSVELVDNAEFRGYINLDLTEAQKDAYPAWANSAAYWEALEGFAEIGVNLALKRERKSGGFLASATQRAGDSPNAGLCVTARGREAATALGRVLFCLTILSSKERWEDVQPLSNPDRW